MRVELVSPYAELCAFGKGTFVFWSRIWFAGSTGNRFWIGTENNNPDSTIATGILGTQTFVEVPNDQTFIVRVRNAAESWEYLHAISDDHVLRPLRPVEYQ